MKISGLIKVLAVSLITLLPCLAFPAPRLVELKISDVSPGTIVIRARERALYFVVSGRQAIRYPIAVPKSGMEWSGHAQVVSKHSRPAWSPPAEVRAAHPELPDVIAGGSPNNPMGEAAILLDRSEIAIHGTTARMRNSIGSAASFGCIRMYNEDVLDLFSRVDAGTPVLMLR